MDDDNVIEFKKKTKVEYEEELFSMYMTIDQDGNYGVHMEVNDVYGDEQIFEALLAAAFKFAEDNLSELEIKEETDGLDATPANDNTIH